MDSEICLVCGKDLPVNRISNPEQSILEEHISAVFVLRKLLDLAPKSLEKYFYLSDGEGPSSWISICGDECQEIVKKAQSAYREMCRARQKLEACQKEIRDKILSSSANLPLSVTPDHTNYRVKIVQTVRDEVEKKCDMETKKEPPEFAAGDRMAEQLWTIRHQLSNQPEVIPQPCIPKVEPESVPEIEVANCPVDQLTSAIIVKPEVYTHVIFPCDECDKSYDTLKLLKKHKQNCHMPRPIKSCPHCDYTSDRGSYYIERHVRIVHQKRVAFICEICQKTVNLRDKFRQHQAFYHSKCSLQLCGKICESRQALRDHQVICHGREVDLFQCPECGQLCRTRIELRDHLKIKHTKGNEIECKCSHCDKGFLTRKQLTNHVRFVHRNKPKSSGGEDLILGI